MPNSTLYMTSLPHLKMAVRRNFNMVEMALALGVVAVGVISILALFPIGLNASRDAMATSYATDSAEQMIHQMEYLLRTNWTTYLPGITDTKPSTDTFTGNLVPNTNGTIFQNAALNATDGRYRIIRYVDNVDKGGTANIYDPTFDFMDFEAVLVVWRETNVLIPSSTGDVPIADPNIAISLNVEVSWPAQLPYAQRQKSFYRKELFKR